MVHRGPISSVPAVREKQRGAEREEEDDDNHDEENSLCHVLSASCGGV